MFFSPSSKGSFSFANVAPGARCAWNFIDDIALVLFGKKTLQPHFPIPKFRPAEEDQCNVIYKIPRASCPWSYIVETKRSFTTRRKEHMRNLSNVAKHAWTRKTLESWHTAKTVGADNNLCPLPRQYHILLKKH